ncbi:hypothetical protein J437_LFUL001103 [Ladona fulva]|uniref:Uncharacterized protein n=1 Tax=Ladona fulva TaxID=123851 RepID=A0A8K0JWM5_LADFU|nr:hypothetical protein J437_LFUL001103 [Ladona fulva]
MNDSTEPLSDAFHDFGVKEVVDGDVIKVSDGRVSFGNEEPCGKEKESLLFEDPMEVADGNIPCHDVLSEKIVNSDEGNFITPNKKLFPVFYKTTPRNSKENLVDGEKSMRESSRFTPRKISDGMEQLIIDAGQKSLAPSTCPECGFFYQKGDADEEKMHKMYHGSGKPGIKHLGWKWERVAIKFPEGRVIRVCSGDPKTWWTKVDSVLEKANDDLGITFTSKLPKNAQAYMFVGDGYILGCVIAEPIRVAYRLLEGDRNEVEKVEVDENKSLEIPKVPSFCSNTPVRGSRCGINRMWTCASERRKGIATKILDSIRATFVYGHILRLDELAFSDPTPLGLSFAQKYTKTASILVYKPCYD